MKVPKSVTMFPFTSLAILSTWLPLIASECACNLTVDQRQIRDNICLDNLNFTLYQHIQNVSQKVALLLNVSFDMDEILKNETSANANSTDYYVLDFVAMGGLETINWRQAVNLDVINEMDTSIYMENAFVLPVMDDLMKQVLSYGFPYGIFRQIEPIPSYVGLDTANNSALCYCIAGGELTLTFTSNASINLRMTSNSFAKFSRTIEDQINSFMAAYDPFKESFIYCRVVNVERPGAAPPQVYLGIMFTEAVEPSVAHHLKNISLALPEEIWAQHLAKSGFVNLYNGTTISTTTSTTPMSTITETLPDPRKLRVSFAYIEKSFDNSQSTSTELQILGIGVGWFLGLLLGLLFLFLGLQLRICSSRKYEKTGSNKT